MLKPTARTDITIVRRTLILTQMDGVPAEPVIIEGGPKNFTFIINALPPRELFPNNAKPGPGWSARNWHGKRAKAKSVYATYVYWTAMEAMRQVGWVAPEKCALTITFIVPSRRQYDADNLLAAFKCGLDALVEVQALAGDGPECIQATTVSTEYVKGQEGVRVVIQEAA
jgi:hypothetical protein